MARRQQVAETRPDGRRVALVPVRGQLWDAYLYDLDHTPTRVAVGVTLEAARAAVGL